MFNIKVINREGGNFMSEHYNGEVKRPKKTSADTNKQNETLEAPSDPTLYSILDQPVELTPLKHDFLRDLGYYIIIILSCGSLLFLMTWIEPYVIKFRYKPCNIYEASLVLVKTMKNNVVLRRILRIPMTTEEVAVAVPFQISGESLERLKGKPRDMPSARDVFSKKFYRDLKIYYGFEKPERENPSLDLENFDVFLKEKDVILPTFEFMCRKFIYNPDSHIFIDLSFNFDSLTCPAICQEYGTYVLDEITVNSRTRLFGPCEIIVPLKSSLELVRTECLHPFYLFQFMSLGLWVGDEYFSYAGAIFFLSVFTLFLSIRDALKNNKELHHMGRFSCEVKTIRKHSEDDLSGHIATLLDTGNIAYHADTIDSSNLVPGDVFLLERGMKLPCDAIFLYGTALVDEAMMTGESKPIYKTGLPGKPEEKTNLEITLEALEEPEEIVYFKENSHKHILYGGTEIRDCNLVLKSGKCYDFAVCFVYQTGFSSEQGKMMRTLVYPCSSNGLNFEKETWKFTALLGGIATFGFAWRLFNALHKGFDLHSSLMRACDTITIAVPPALPIIIQVGILQATDALQKKNNTRCLMRSRINVAGRVNAVVFDKTGTLTEDDEDLFGVVSCIPEVSKATDFASNKEDPYAQANEAAIQVAYPVVMGPVARDPSELAEEFVLGLATCHSLTFANDKLIGDPLEYQMFNFTGFKLIPPTFKKSLAKKVEEVCPSNKPGEYNPDEIDFSAYICVGKREDSYSYVSSKTGSSIQFSSDARKELRLMKANNKEPKCSEAKLDESGSLKTNISPIFEQGNDKNDTKKMMNGYNMIKMDDVFSDTSSIELLTEPRDVAIVKVYEFDSFLRRMSVVIKEAKTKRYRLYCKGSPDSIASLCVESSKPVDWYPILDKYEKKGFRILAMAVRTFSDEFVQKTKMFANAKRAEAESSLNLLGVLLFTNLPRPETGEAIEELKNAGCALYMATGDGFVTGVAIGVESGLISENVEKLVLAEFKDNSIVWSMRNFTSKNPRVPDEKIIEPFYSSTANSGETVATQGDSVISTRSCSSNFEEEGTENKVEALTSESLLSLVEGHYLSSVALGMTGEAFRHLVDIFDDKNPSLIPKSSPLYTDQFKLQSYKMENHQESSCLICCKPKLEQSLTNTHKLGKRSSRNEYINTYEFVLRYFQIFCRMSPSDKSLLVNKIRELPNKPVVGMCGDGANDCEALKAADVGISLSSKEASVAAPFNSSIKTIRIVIDVLKEGKGALSNSIQSFQFAALYALIQLTSVTLLSECGASLSDPQFLYMDMILLLPLTFFMSWSPITKTLTRSCPSGSLLAWSIVASLIGQSIINLIAQILVLLVVLPQVGKDFFEVFQINQADDGDVMCFENTVLFLLSNIQTITSAVILAFGTLPWKKTAQNYYFILTALGFGILGFALILNEASYMGWIRNLLTLESLPLYFRVVLFLLVCANTTACVCYDNLVVRRWLQAIEISEDFNNLNRDSLRDKNIDEKVLKMDFPESPRFNKRQRFKASRPNSII